MYERKRNFHVAVNDEVSACVCVKTYTAKQAAILSLMHPLACHAFRLRVYDEYEASMTHYQVLASEKSGDLSLVEPKIFYDPRPMNPFSANAKDAPER